MIRPVPIPYSAGADSTAVSSPNKGLSYFVITAADNPTVLKTDVAADLYYDTIKLTFEKGTDISSLVPTIGFTGKTISPASKTPQNFDSTLTYTLTANDGSFLFYHVGVVWK